MELLHQLLFLPERASTFADQVDGLHYFVLLTTMVVSTAVGLTALFFFVRYRRRAPRQLTPRIAPPGWVEALFVVVPMGFFLSFFTMGYRDFVWVNTPPADAFDVFVMGKQWMWKFSYPEGPSAIDVLRVPAGRPVRLLLTSRDVIHSFFVPEFRIKQDALPGRYTQTWFTATKPGRYQVLCAEFCGSAHSLMRGEVIVLEGPAFDAWLEEQRLSGGVRMDAEPAVSEQRPASAGMVEQGRRIALEQGCVRCHSTDGTPHIGPTWLDLYRRVERLESGETIVADEAYLTQSMMDPRAQVVAGFDPVMPSFRGRLQAPEVAALVELIKSLRDGRFLPKPSSRSGR